MRRVIAALALVALAGCGFALDAAGQAPQQCGLEGEAIGWSGTAALDQMGLEAPAGFPRSEIGDVFVTAGPVDGRLRAFCILLPDAGVGGGPWIVTGDVPDNWEAPLIRHFESPDHP